ncbi:DMT family transporter [Antrihabitans cavernicola]|uniref:DMT family transporter n=1 Tax=Antrihabitans cavernicola TaxID=2495913 RepID=A0A5A7S5R9_9NOCA|nr:DMT family transporter [Spelaeibacter cavernicola]KAA0020055.1 hypothetical protein FOY51_22095 [Spelaeibacter cavernicola]
MPYATIVCSLIAALLFACAAVAQQHAASSVPEGESLMSELIRKPRWWAGIAGDGGGYAMQAIALSLGSVLIVQPLLVSAVVFALPLAARFSGRRITPRMWALAAALTGALAVFLVVGNPSEGKSDAPFSEWAVPLIVLLVVVGVATAGGLARIEVGLRALLLGAAGGLLFGLAAALTKDVTDRFGSGIWSVLTSWQTWILIASGIVGVYLQQRAFQVGPLSASLPAVTIAEPLAAVFVGMTVLDERLRADALGIGVTAAAVVVMAVATLLLSRSQAQSA